MDIPTNLLQELSFFTDNYIAASNAAAGSKYDPNSNVSIKNNATLDAELAKGIKIELSRYRIKQRITNKYGAELARQFQSDLDNHLIYVHDETANYCRPYCASIDIMPMIENGVIGLGGQSKAPKNLDSFCGIFTNMVYEVAAQFAGAVATTQFLPFMEVYIRKDYGEQWWNREDIYPILKQKFQQVVYTINEPAAARGFQSIFWNISIFDKDYFNAIMAPAVFPDEEFSQPDWEGTKRLQEIFMDWFAEERTKAELTFPVITAAILTENGHVKDQAFVKMLARNFGKGNTTFVYMSDTPDSLASCCRLRNEVNDFSFSLGAGGVKTGSMQVITINFNRLVQTEGLDQLEAVAERVRKYLVCYRDNVVDNVNAHMVPAYDSGFISYESQYVTIGINGLVEAAEFLGYTASNNAAYKMFLQETLNKLYTGNRKFSAEHDNLKLNTEYVPAENLGVKNAKWDSEDGLIVPRKIYNSYFYVVEDENTNPFDKFILHGHEINQYLDGGSALHLNMDTPLDEERFIGLCNVAATSGCNYWTVNIDRSPCPQCGYIEPRPVSHCPKCNSVITDRITRVIGYAKRVSAWSLERQSEYKRRYNHH